MSSWRKLFVIVLLALSLPVQSLAAVSMKCVIAPVEMGSGAAEYLEPRAPAAHHEAHGAALADGEHHDHQPSKTDHARPCATHALCCFGAALPASPTVAVFADATGIATPILPSAGAVSFLTDGIERPPRHLLV